MLQIEENFVKWEKQRHLTLSVVERPRHSNKSKKVLRKWLKRAKTSNTKFSSICNKEKVSKVSKVSWPLSDVLSSICYCGSLATESVRCEVRICWSRTTRCYRFDAYTPFYDKSITNRRKYIAYTSLIHCLRAKTLSKKVLDVRPLYFLNISNKTSFCLRCQAWPFFWKC